MARYAVVCLVMRGDAYVPGALVTAFSARRAAVHADLVCMVRHPPPLLCPPSRAAPPPSLFPSARLYRPCLTVCVYAPVRRTSAPWYRLSPPWSAPTSSRRPYSNSSTP